MDSNLQVSATVYAPNGDAIVPPQQTLGAAGTYTSQDSNGNVITATVSASQTVFTDTLGTTVLTISGTNPVSYTYPVPNGGSATIQVIYSSYNVATNFGVPNVVEYSNTASLVSEIDLPDVTSNPSDKYTLTYEPTPGHSGVITGRIASVTLPTGGSISYDYFAGYNGINADGSTAGIHRTLNDGANSNVSAYWTNGSGSTTVVDPQNNETDLTFSSNLYETQRQIYQGRSGTGSTVLETVVTCWNGVGPSTCGTGATVTPPIQNRIRYTELPTTSRHDEYFNSAGLLTETDDLDWGYAFLQKKLITYAALGNNILDRPSSTILQDGNGNVLAQTNYYYDDYSVNGIVQTNSYSPPPPQHVVWTALSGSRGNLTSVSQWVSGSTTQGAQGSVYLTKQFTYFDTGMLSSAIDVNGAITRYNYPSNDPNNTSCGLAFPTSVTPPQGSAGVDLTSSTTWDCNGGVATSTTDPNGRTVATTGWDPKFWRPTAVTDQTMGYTQLFSYTPTSADTHWGINNTSTVHTKTTVDGLGRTHVSQREQGYNSPNFDSAETDYDADGRPYLTTIGYVGTAGQSYCSSHGLPSNCNPPGTTTTYDALGRPTQVTAADGQGITKYTYSNNDVLIEIKPAPAGENTKQRQYEYDVLGRLTSVCEVTSGTGSGPCGQSNPLNGYLTKYTYDAAGRLLTVTQNAQPGGGTQQTRSFTYDGLGRMLSENNPETGSTTYTYDSYSGSCTVSTPGDLAAKHDATGNTTCYMYDLLHRLYIIGYYDGGQNTTPAKFFIYDAATVNGQTMQNAKGHLARTYTMYTPYTTVSTDEGFSYSPRGEVTDVYQSTPHSSGFYHLNASYWSHGPMQTLNPNISGMPTITYGASDASGLDVEGRITKVMASSGINPAPSATINTTDPSTSGEPLGALLSVNLGTTTSGVYDSDSFTYDPNTGRLHTYQFSVNGHTDTGTLTWNANGSLQQLGVADNIPGTTDSQTCNYSSDDLGRVATANCGTGQNQSFGYDPFGNIQKTASAGVGNFIVGYNQANNRINNTGYTYDSNGNLLTDATGSHNYSWDAEGRPTCMDGVVLTYDASGRLVEQARGGTCASPGTNYQQIVYGPGGGKLALMNGQTLNKAFVPIPGGATAVYNSSGLQYYRHSDWLGSSRLDSTPARTVYSWTAYAPFGEPYSTGGTPDPSFTGQNQDTVAGLYDFMLREQSPIQGRWISPDPAGLGAVSLTDPQSWNRYAYVSNSPLTATDPLGLACKGSGPDRCQVDPTVNELGFNPFQMLFQAADMINTPTALARVQFDNGWYLAFYYGNRPAGLAMLSALSSFGFSGSGGGPSGGGVSGTTQQQGTTCRQPNFMQRLVIPVQAKLANTLNTTIGVGLGGTVGAGLGLGWNFSFSRQLVVTPYGEAAFATTVSHPNESMMPNALMAGGYGGYGGFQVSAANAIHTSDLAGKAGDLGVGGGRGWGGGIDAQTDWGPVLQETLTLGGGAGGWGHGFVPVNTTVDPICGTWQ